MPPILDDETDTTMPAPGSPQDLPQMPPPGPPQGAAAQAPAQAPAMVPGGAVEPQAAMGPSGPAPVQGAAPGGGVTPERQMAYDLVVTRSLELLYGSGDDNEGQLQMVVKQLQDGGEQLAAPAGKMAGEIVAGQAASAKGAGATVDAGVLFHALREVTSEVLRIADAAGLPVAKEAGQQAYMIAIEVLGRRAKEQGLVSKQQLQALAAKVAQAKVPEGAPEGLKRIMSGDIGSVVQRPPPAAAQGAPAGGQQPGIIPPSGARAPVGPGGQ